MIGKHRLVVSFLSIMYIFSDVALVMLLTKIFLVVDGYGVARNE